MVAKPVLSVLMPLLQDCLRSGTKAHEDGLTEFPRFLRKLG